jgi:hypothetical protein
VRLEESASAIDRVGRLSKADAERHAGFVTGFGRLHEGLEIPAIRFRGSAGRIHFLDVDASMLLEQINT